MLQSAVTGNQQTRPNKIASWTDEPIVSPVNVSALASFLAVDGEDELLEMLLDAATEAVITYTGVQVIERTWHWKADRYPERMPAMTGVAANGALPEWWITLPAWPANEITTVSAEDFTFDKHTNRLWVTRPTYPLEVEYKAGYVDAPPVFKQAILMLAAYLYEHRGECDAAMAGEHSGAFGMLKAHKRIAGGL